jgi:hypothetical protein
VWIIDQDREWLWAEHVELDFRLGIAIGSKFEAGSTWPLSSGCYLFFLIILLPHHESEHFHPFLSILRIH